MNYQIINKIKTKKKTKSPKKTIKALHNIFWTRK